MLKQVKHFHEILAVLKENASMLPLLNEIRNRGPIQKSKVGECLTVSKPTRYSLMQGMLDLDLIQERVTSENGKHRRSSVINIKSGQYFSLGIDLHMEGTSILVLDLDQTVISSKYFPNSINKEKGITKDNRTAIVKRLQREIPIILDESHIRIHQIIGVGISDASLIDSDDRVSVFNRYIEDWEDVPIGNILSRVLPVPIFLARDANMSALAERRNIDQEIAANAICVTLRHGVGLGIFINGRIYTGQTGNAGEWSIMNLFSREDNSGKYEDLDSLLGIASLRKIALSLNMSNHEEALSIAQSDDNTMKILFDAYESDNDEIEAALNSYINLLATHLANLIFIFDISHIIVAGRFTFCGEKFRSELETGIRQLIRGFRDINIIRGKLGTSSAVLGAAHMAQETVLDQL